MAPLLEKGLDLCVCVPARNEAARLPVLFRGLAAQSRPGPIKVIVALNNTTDDSHQVLAQARSDYCGRLYIHVEEATFAAELAHAGSARRLAMDAGLTLLPSHDQGILVSTDADTFPPPHWLDNMVRAFARGADLVGGRIAIDTAEELPKNVLALRQAWEAYWEAVRAIEDSLDPLPWNPAPRHGDHTGASLALRACLYTRCGGCRSCALAKIMRWLWRQLPMAGAWLIRPMFSPGYRRVARGGLKGAWRRTCRICSIWQRRAVCRAPPVSSIGRKGRSGESVFARDRKATKGSYAKNRYCRRCLAIWFWMCCRD